MANLNLSTAIENWTNTYHPFPDGFCPDLFWDTSVSWHTSTPDFTACFQKTVLVWTPSTYLSVLALYQWLIKARCGKMHAPIWTRLLLCKVVSSVFLIAFSLIDGLRAFHLFRTVGPVAVPVVDLMEPMIKSFTFIINVGLTFMDNQRVKPSSGPLFMFWFLILLADVIGTRTAIGRFTNKGIRNDFKSVLQIGNFFLVLSQFFLACFADSFPDTQAGKRNQCPEKSSSVLNQATFWWMTRLVRLGWRKPLDQSDLWDLDADDKAHKYSVRLETHWQNELQRQFRSESHLGPPEKAKKRQKLYVASLSKAVAKTISRTFMKIVCLRVTMDLSVFISPLILRLLIAFVSDNYQESWKGFLYVALMFFAAVLQILSANYYYFLCQRCGMHIHSALMSIVYQKALKLSNATRRSTTTGAIVNLMADDSQRLGELVERVQIFWSAPFQITLAVYVLWQLLGPSTLAGLAAMLLLVPLNSVIIRILRKLLVKNAEIKDERMRLMNEILGAMKILKLHAWEPTFRDRVLAIRKLELASLAKAAYINAATAFISMVFPFILASVTFTTYVLSDPSNVLDASKAFVSLSLFHILRQPASNFPDVIGAVIQVKVSIKRLSKFLRSCELDTSSVHVIPSSVRAHTSSITVSNGTFSWGLDEAFCLKNINLDILEGEFVAVVGDVGAGKTSLCCAMMGFMDKLLGKVVRKGNVAYVSQQAWIQNLSIKENILFGNKFDKCLYDKVLDACALRADLDLLPAEDSTEIGERGINLSGGQRQRISLARAVYSNADIYLLDDPLSAVDAHVGRHVFDSIIGGTGMLKDKARILVTHGVDYLPQTDRIVIMMSGMISEVGTCRQLQQKGYFASLENQLANVAEIINSSAVTGADIFKEIHPEGPLTNHGTATLKSRVSRTIVADPITAHSPAVGSPKAKTKSHRKNCDIPLFPVGSKHNYNNGKLMKTEVSETGGVKWNVYIMYLKHFTAPVGLAVMCLYICAAAVGVGTNFWLRDWSQDTEDEVRKNSADLKSFRLLIYAVIGWTHAFFVLSASLVLTYGQNIASQKQHEGMLLRILHAPMTFFDTTPLGRIVNRFGKDVGAVDTSIPSNLRSWLNCVINVITTIVVICLNTPIFVAVVVPLAIMYYLIQRFFMPTGRQLKRLQSISRSPIYSHLQESLAGQSLIFATNSAQRFVQQNERLIDKSNEAAFPNIASEMWLSLRVELLGSFVAVFAGIFAVVGRDQSWGISPRDIALVVTYALSVTATLNRLVFVATNLEANLISVERIKEYTEIPIEAPWDIEGKHPEDDWPQEGIVEFKSYETRYRPDLDPVLKGISCQTKIAEKIGIVGRTGAGKSSLTLALFRIIEGTMGSIIVDNIDISTIGLHGLRSKISIIPQEPVLFSGTLQFNLDPVAQYSDDVIWEAVRDAHLKPLVSSLKGGLQYLVAEEGSNFSVGQRQLICLARALLRRTKILVLDEPTSAVDLATDALIQRIIREKFVHCTVLTIAHRLSTILDCSRVLVLDQGLVREFDSPSSLLQDDRSLFYGLINGAMQ